MNLKWFELLKKLEDADALPKRILLFGPPGTGKSHYGTKLHSWERLTLHGQTDPADLQGSWVLCSIDGATDTRWADGPAPRAMRCQGNLILDEITRGSGEAQCLLYAILDKPAGLTLPTGERVNAGENFRVIATTNDSPEMLEDALLDRFDIVLHCTIPTDEQFRSLTPDMQDVLRNDYQRRQYEPWTRPMSFRTLRSVLEIEPVIGLQDACEAVMGPTAGPQLFQSLSAARVR